MKCFGDAGFSHQKDLKHLLLCYFFLARSTLAGLGTERMPILSFSFYFLKEKESKTWSSKWIRNTDLAKGRKACYTNQSKSDFIYLHPSIPPFYIPFGCIYVSPIYMYIYQRGRKNKSKSNHCRRRWKKIWCWNQPTILLYDLHEIKNNMVFES